MFKKQRLINTKWDDLKNRLNTIIWILGWEIYNENNQWLMC